VNSCRAINVDGDVAVTEDPASVAVRLSLVRQSHV
jgi:hypothetical protein